MFTMTKDFEQSLGIYPEEELLKQAEYLIARPYILLSENADILDRTSYLQFHTEDRQSKVLNLLENANEAMPAVSEIVIGTLIRSENLQGRPSSGIGAEMKDLVEIINSQSDVEKAGGEALQTISDIFLGLEADSLHSRFKLSKHEYYLAVSQIGVHLSATLYATSPEDTKGLWHTYTFYLVAIQSLLVGGRTNSNFFAEYPEKLDVTTLDRISPAMLADEEEDVRRSQIRHIFEGKSATQIESYQDGVFTYLSPSKSEPPSTE